MKKLTKGRNMKKLWIITALGLLAACRNYAETKTVTAYEQPMVPNPYQEDKYQDQRMYTVAASRVVNKMLKETEHVYRKTPRPNIFVRPVKKLGSEHLPEGFSSAQTTAEQIIAGSSTYVLTRNPDNAKYYLDMSVSKLEVDSLPGTVVQYKAVLFDRWNHQVGTWTEVIRQVQNDDKSWW